MKEPVALVQALARKYAQLAKCLDGYSQVAEADVGGPYRKQNLLTRIHSLIDILPESIVKDQLLGWCQSEETRVDQEREEFKFLFLKEMGASLSRLGMGVRGQIPTLRIGFFTVKVDLQRGVAAIYWGPQVERLKENIVLVPDELITALQKCTEELCDGSEADPRELLNLLYSAYRRCVLCASASLGTRIALSEVFRELVMLRQPPAFQINPVRENLREYPRVQFSYDLFRLRQTGFSEIEGVRLRLHVATFDAAAEKTKALWVPDNEMGEGTNYSHISFVPVELHDHPSSRHPS